MGYRLKVKEKIGYGLGDAASSMFWKLFSMYLLFFYTDVFGISAAAAGTMFLLTRIWDATNDPFMGIIADRTKSRWGKFRPYLLWLAIPFGIIGVLLFTTPDLENTGKIVYAYVTYTVMMMVYTGINVPYAALMGVMTSDSKQRTSLSSYRMVFAFAGSILVLAIFQPLFDGFGSTQINTYYESHMTMSASSQITGETMLYSTASTAAVYEFPDSLLVLNLKVKTLSKELLQVGFISDESSQPNYITIGTSTDALGIKRDGDWNTLKLNIKDIYSDNNIPSDIAALQVMLSANGLDQFEFEGVKLDIVDRKGGTQKAVMVIAVIAAIFFLLCFSWTKERVKPIKEETSSVKDDFKDLLKNRPWFILLGAGIATLIFNSIRDGASIYYFRYFIQDEGALEISILGFSFPFALSTSFLVIGQIANIGGVLLARPLSDRLGKKYTYMTSMILAAIFSIGFYFLDRNALVLIFVFQVIINVCAGSIYPLLWSMYADIADYSEWKTGRRATGLIFSSSSMSQKFGWTLGGAITGWLLAAYGFEAGTVQSAETQHALRMMLSVFPAIGAAIAAIFIYTYKLTDAYMEKINAELEQKRVQK
jgi:GPH family glycoside/pentoside/hexuronide:cation symporter